jgi:hypothetical protein
LKRPARPSATRRSTALVVGLLAAGTTLFAQALTATKAAAPPPSDLAPAIATLLSPDAITVNVADVPIKLWWVRALPLETAPSGAPKWSDVSEGTLIGVLTSGGLWHDIRGYVLKPGTYTLRFAMQPQNGDHLGVSPNREFLLLAPAAVDTAPGVTGEKGAIDLSKKAVNRAHPSALSLDPPIATRPPLSPVSNELGLDGVVFTVPASFQNMPVGEISFGLILRGTIQQ